jgi:hypothetical protein
MRVEAIGGPSYIGPEACLTGVSAALAEARRVPREAAPPGTFDRVLAEVHRVRASESMSLLDALGAVFQRMATGTYVPDPASAAA